MPPPLRVNQFGIGECTLLTPMICAEHILAVPIVAQAFEGKVAARGLLNSMVVTSPNMDFVPEYGIERRVIETHTDGRWGVHEYSRWPQMLVAGMTHVACIPAARNPPAAPQVLWTDLDPSSSWREDPDTGVDGLGFIIPEIAQPLAEAASSIISSLDTSKCSDEKVVSHADTVKLILRQAVQRMLLLAARPGIAVAVAAHVQRLTLELLGMQTYIETVLPRMSSAFNYEFLILPVIGAYVQEGTAAQALTRVGIPTWFLQPMTKLVKIWRVVDITPVPWNLSRDQSQPPVYQNPRVLAGVTNTTGNWLRSMALSVSEAVCGSRLRPLGETSDADDVRSSKRRHLAGDPLPSKHLHMAPPQPVPQRESAPGKKKTRRGGQKKKGAAAQGAAPDEGTDSGVTRSAGAREPHTDALTSSSATSQGPESHPSRTFTPSPFSSVAEVWASALQSVSPVAEPPRSAVYFFPPPFLLDSVVEPNLAPPPPTHSGVVRVDRKSPRYVHNWVRIRMFCRMRLFDPSVSNEPLTIAEWLSRCWQIPY